VSIEIIAATTFEDGNCYDCDEFHDGILADERVQAEIAPYTVLRLDADSSETILDFYGNETTPAALASKYQMIYRPGVLVFEDGELLRRHDSLTFPHHFKGATLPAVITRRPITTVTRRDEPKNCWRPVSPSTSVDPRWNNPQGRITSGGRVIGRCPSLFLANGSRHRSSSGRFRLEDESAGIPRADVTRRESRSRRLARVCE